LTTSNALTSRICASPVALNASIARRAWSASRRVCEKSFTVVMFEYASVMRPVISARASACRLPTAPRRGTKYAQAAP